MNHFSYDKQTESAQHCSSIYDEAPCGSGTLLAIFVNSQFAFLLSLEV
jgi:hypothetical protein